MEKEASEVHSPSKKRKKQRSVMMKMADKLTLTCECWCSEGFTFDKGNFSILGIVGYYHMNNTKS